MPTTSGESSIAIVCPSRTGVPTSTSSRTTRPANCAKSAVTVFALNSMRPGTDARTGTSPCATALLTTLARCAGASVTVFGASDGRFAATDARSALRADSAKATTVATDATAIASAAQTRRTIDEPPMRASVMGASRRRRRTAGQPRRAGAGRRFELIHAQRERMPRLVVADERLVVRALRVEQAEEAALALLIRGLLDGADLGGLLQDVAVEQAQPVAADAVGDDRLLDVGEDLRAHLPPARFGLQLRGRHLRDRRVRAAAGRQRHADGDADSVVGPRSQVLAADGDVARAARVGERHRRLRRVQLEACRPQIRAVLERKGTNLFDRRRDRLDDQIARQHIDVLVVEG